MRIPVFGSSQLHYRSEYSHRFVSRHILSQNGCCRVSQGFGPHADCCFCFWCHKPTWRDFRVESDFGVKAEVGFESAKGSFWRKAAVLQGEPEAVALDCALKFESRVNSRPSMVCLCRGSCFCRLLSPYRCCRSSRRLRRRITGWRHDGAAMASCLAIISHRVTAFRFTPRKLRFRAWCATTGALGISTQSQVITGTMATGTTSAGLAFMVVATMAVASALAGRGRRSGRSGIAAD